MNNSEKFHSRIDLTGDIVPVLHNVSKNFQLGDYKGHSVVEVGYEDYNLGVETNKGKYFVKIFGAFRSEDDCKRYVDLMERVIAAGVRLPKLYGISGTAQHLFRPEGTNLQLVVMEWIDGKSFFDLDTVPTDEEIADICEQATKINKINVELPFLYDSWAVINIGSEYKKWQEHISEEDKVLIEPVVSAFDVLDINSLPKAVVHGDLIKTNVLRSNGGKLYVVDFAVANNYPRIQELAVLCCNLLFDEHNPENSKRLQKLAVEEYQKYLPLSEEELTALPIFIRAAHAMHVIGATKSEVQGEGSKENDYWLNLGRIGLKQ